MRTLPSGVVTFLFTDIEASSELFAARPDEYPALLALHNAAIRQAIEDHGGHVVSTEGDAFFAAFGAAAAALRAAVAAQQALRATVWPPGVELRVRMGLHTGNAEPTNGDYVAFCVHQAARVVATGNGGQIVVSSATAATAGDDTASALVARGRYQLRDFREPEQLFTVEWGGWADHAPLRGQPERTENLPKARTTLVGRDAEMEAVLKLLERSRVVTLTGPGGVGKTRAATAVAAAEVDRRDGVWFCALDAVSDPNLVLHTVAEATGRRLRSGSTDELARLIGDSNTLVVLDNCEHVLDAAAAVVDALVSACPELQVLATSQAPLEIDGEHVFRVAPLDAAGKASPALALFLERAEAAGCPPLDEREIHAAAELVSRLDGMPLAIELAAARTSSLSPTEITARLEHRFAVLTSTRRDIAPRRRTLQATIAWSYDLLAPAHAACLRRLGYFAGTFDLAAAESLAAVDGLATIDMLEAIGVLVNRSLVVVDGEGQRRYRLLDSIRAFALEQATQTGEDTALALAHARWVLRQLPKPTAITDLAIDPSVRGKPAAHLHQDMTAAIDRMLGRSAPVAAEMAWRASTVWIYLLRFDEAIDRLRAAMSITDDPYDKGRCVQALAFVESLSGRESSTASYGEAAELLAQAAESTDDPVVLAYATLAHVNAAEAVAPIDRGEWARLLELAEKLAARNGDAEATAQILGSRAWRAHEEGRDDDADTLSTAQVEASRALPGPALGLALLSRASMARARGDLAGGRKYLREAADALAGEPKQAAVLQQLAITLVETGEPDAPALARLAQAEDVAASFGWFDQVIIGHLVAAQIHARTGDAPAALARLDAADDLVGAVALDAYAESAGTTRRVVVAMLNGDVDTVRAVTESHTETRYRVAELWLREQAPN